MWVLIIIICNWSCEPKEFGTFKTKEDCIEARDHERSGGFPSAVCGYKYNKNN